jgi:hypothetical protein
VGRPILFHEAESPCWYLAIPATRGLVAPLPIGQSVRVASRHSSSAGSDDGALLALFGAIASRDHTQIARQLDSSLRLASRPICIAASRHDADTYFLAAIRHYVCGGDTALHLLRNGASQTDVDANGKSVAAAVSSDWIRHLLDTP